MLTEATAMIASYLTAERELGRIAPDADVDTLAPTLIGSAHLLFAGRGRRRAGGWIRPQGRDHGHRRRRARTAAMTALLQAFVDVPGGVPLMWKAALPHQPREPRRRCRSRRWRW